MREIKFRMLDGKELFKVSDLSFYADGTIGNFGSMHKIYIGSSCMLMQFTGLLDKAGKEIYEGDIIQFGIYKPAEVFYSDYLAGFCLKFKDGQDEKSAITRMIGPSLVKLKWVDKNIEIIGNIYENPELLERSKNVQT